MKNMSRSFTKTSLTLAVASLLGSVASSVSAAEWHDGDWSATLSSSFSLGTSIRVEDRDWSLIGNSNHTQFQWAGYDGMSNTVYSSADIWSQSNGSYSTNGDNSDLMYDPGKPFSTLFKGNHELDIRYQDMGVFIRGMYFYDFEMMNNDRAWANPVSSANLGAAAYDPCDDSAAREELCADVRLLDAFVYFDFDLGDVPVNLRIGDQVVNWGESTFIQHGINTTNPVDVTRAVSPGAEIKEIIIPVGMVFASLGLTDNLGLSMYYQYEWEKYRLPQAGSYFSTTDFAGEGGNNALIQLGFTGNPDIDLNFLLAGLNNIRDSLRAGGDPVQLASAYLAYPTKVAVRAHSDAADVEPSDNGQFGLKLSYYAEELNDTEFGLYYINYHSQRPLISGVTSNFTTEALMADLAYIAQADKIDQHNVTNLQAFTQARFYYPEDIGLFGVSFNTVIGDTALAGEMAYRMDEPLQVDDVELLYVGMPQQLANAGLRPELANISQFNSYYGTNIGPGETAQGYILSDTVQAQVTASQILGPVLGTDNLILLAELGYVQINDMPDQSELRLNGPGTGRSGLIVGKEGLHTAISNGPEMNPFPTDSAWGYRLLAKADFYNVFSGTNLSVRGTFAHDVNGITPDPLSLFIEDRKSSSISFTFDYLGSWSASAAYNAYWGGVGTTNLLSDRDFISFNIKYSI